MKDLFNAAIQEIEEMKGILDLFARLWKISGIFLGRNQAEATPLINPLRLKKGICRTTGCFFQPQISVGTDSI